jgi:hypothetical protein
MTQAEQLSEIFNLKAGSAEPIPMKRSFKKLVARFECSLPESRELSLCSEYRPSSGGSCAFLNGGSECRHVEDT